MPRMATTRRSDLSPDEKLAADVALALSTPHRPKAERVGRVSPRREIACRSCGRWTTHETGVWRHDDGTVACVDPATLEPPS